MSKNEIEEKEEVSTMPLAVDVDEDEDEDIVPKKKKLPNWMIFVVVGIIVLLAAVMSLMQKKGTPQATQLSMTKVVKGDVTEIYNSSGIVESGKKKTYYSPVNAPVLTCDVKVGESVKAGTKVVTFDTKNLEIDNQKSILNQQSTSASNRATVEANNQTIAKAEQAANEANQAVVNEYNSVVDQYNAIVETLPGLQEAADLESIQNEESLAQIAPLQMQLEEKQNELTQSGLEYEEAIYNQSNYEAYKASNPSPLLTEAQLLEKVNSLRTKIEITLPAEIADLQNQIAQYVISTQASEAYAMAAAQADELNGMLNSMSGQLGAASADAQGLTSGQSAGMAISEDLAALTTLTAAELVEKGREGISVDFDGVVSEVKASEGGSATQGGELFTVVSNEDVRVKIEASVNDYSKLGIGKKAVITIGSNTYDGEVTAIDKIATTNAKGNSVVCAYAKITNPDENICIGVTGKVKITVDSVSGVLTLPSEVVNSSTDGEFVYVISEGVVKKMPVEIGVTSDKLVEIKSGLKEGDAVVADMSVDVEEGMNANPKESE